MRHKIEVWYGGSGVPLWYVQCSCGWQPDRAVRSFKLDANRYGRDTWDAAFALGVAHQQNVNGRGEADARPTG